MNTVIYLEDIVREANREQFMIDLMWEFKKAEDYTEFGKAVEELLIRIGRVTPD